MIHFSILYSRLVLSHIVLAVALFVTTGCGGAGAGVSDVEAATQLLKQSFEQWKAGQTPASLRQQTPAVYVADDLWEQDARLSDFSVDGPGEQYGTNVRVRVTIAGRHADGRSFDQKVNYLVTTVPALTIVREDR